METKTEIIGVCPIGQLVKETKIDRFGFFAGERIYKLVRDDWWLYNLFEKGDKGFTYSDYRFYYPHANLREADE